MEQHPIPRQITTFEFKLIGFMTIRQFGYVVLGGIFGYAAFLIMPINILNYISGVAVFCAFLAFAFVPVNDRPLDVFIKDLYERLNSPTQYTFRKDNTPPRVMADMYFESNPHITLAHAESREKLAAYLAKKAQVKKDDSERQNAISRINVVIANKQAPKNAQFAAQAPSMPDNKVARQVDSPKLHVVSQKTAAPPAAKHPFFSGTVTNTRNIPLPGVLVYVKDGGTGGVLRILKTNPFGVFATFNPLPPNGYLIDIVDPADNYKFDSRTVSLGKDEKQSAVFVSKEAI